MHSGDFLTGMADSSGNWTEACQRYWGDPLSCSELLTLLLAAGQTELGCTKGPSDFTGFVWLVDRRTYDVPGRPSDSVAPLPVEPNNLRHTGTFVGLIGCSCCQTEESETTWKTL
jgi:hypothetical protein